MAVAKTLQDRLQVEDTLSEAQATFSYVFAEGDYEKAASILIRSSCQRALYLCKRDNIRFQPQSSSESLNIHALSRALSAEIEARAKGTCTFALVAREIFIEICAVKDLIEGKVSESTTNSDRVAMLITHSFELGNLHSLGMMVETGHIDNLSDAIETLRRGKSKGGDSRAQQLRSEAKAWQAVAEPKIIALCQRPSLKYRSDVIRALRKDRDEALKILPGNDDTIRKFMEGLEAEGKIKSFARRK